MVVHAGAHDVDLRLEALADVPTAIPSAVGEINVEIFGLRRPVRREHPLDAAARRPARGGGAKAKSAHLPIGEAAGAVDQQGRRDKVADAAAHGAKPGQVYIAPGHGPDGGQVAVRVIGGLKERQRGVVATAADAGALKVGLDAKDELIELEVVADLSAAEDAAGAAERIAVGQEEQVGRPRPPGTAPIA